MWIIFLPDSTAKDPNEQMRLDLHTPDVCRDAQPPIYMTCRRAKIVSEHFLRIVQAYMCECSFPLDLEAADCWCVLHLHQTSDCLCCIPSTPLQIPVGQLRNQMFLCALIILIQEHTSILSKGGAYICALPITSIKHQAAWMSLQTWPT